MLDPNERETRSPGGRRDARLACRRTAPDVRLPQAVGSWKVLLDCPQDRDAIGRAYPLIVPTVLYVAIALILIAFGYLALFSIGWPFALTGILMLALIGERRRAKVLAPALAWPWAFTLGYILVAPLGCSTSAMPQIAEGGRASVEGSTRCNAVFFTYAGGADYSPPLLPALLTGVALATAASLAIRWSLRRRQIQGSAAAV